MSEPSTTQLTEEPVKTEETPTEEDFAERLVKLAQRRRNEQVDKKNQTYRAQLEPPSSTDQQQPEDLRNGWLQAGFAETCGRRRTMEDAHVIDTRFRHVENKDEVFIGIFDGHGGKDAADYLGRELHNSFRAKLSQLEEFLAIQKQIRTEPENEELFKKMRKANDELTPKLNRLLLEDYNRNEIKQRHQESVHQLLNENNTSAVTEKKSEEYVEKESSIEPIEYYDMTEAQIIPCLLRETFLQVNEQLCETIRSGATASVAYFHHDGICYVANVGDSRILFADSNGNLKRLTVDHRPDDSDEQRRVKEAGGFIVNNRVNAVLAVTRALGDADLHPYISSDPHTNSIAVRSGQVLIIACDGLWDFVKDEKVFELIRDVNDSARASTILRDYAYQQGSTDNISIIVVRVGQDSK
jgi:protein phosphatase PTC1